ncbi:MAG: 2OG-Fe(II) oxygenase [Taibaiella sp.]|nr:2OG-Fe(II) oxygenase [Taibaiella sp.]
MIDRYEELIERFIDNKIGLCEHFLTLELAKLLQQNLLDLERDERMVFAGIGNNAVKDQHQKQRGDKIYWIDKKNKNLSELAFLEEVENFIDHLNKTCYTGINAYEFHYALYDVGSCYQRHKDQFKNNTDRKYSLISYLNDDWNKDDGGELMIYLDEKTETILPTIRKAVFFQSNELEHAVLTAKRPRMSITGWLKRS